MPHANRPSGPAKPIEVRRDAVLEAEGIDEIAADREGAPEALDNSGRHARHADRDASVPERGRNRSEGRGGG